jgi:uncharacterized protein
VPSHLDIVATSLDALSRGDVDAHCQHLADDVVLEFPFASPPVRVEGRESVRAYLRGALEVFELTLSISRAIEADAGAILVVEFESDGIAKPTQRPYQNSYVAIFEFRDDKICAQREYYNPVRAADALS